MWKTMLSFKNTPVIFHTKKFWDMLPFSPFLIFVGYGFKLLYSLNTESDQSYLVWSPDFLK